MNAPIRACLRTLLVLALPATLVACAPAPLYKTGPHSVNATPQQVATSPQNFQGMNVVWGGSVVSIKNLADHSEVEILAYPLDDSQRPVTGKPSLGRFIAIMPGYVEPMNYPEGALVTVHGSLSGARTGLVGQADYNFALLRGDDAHRWTAAEMTKGHPNIRVGVGIGIGGRIR